MISDRLIQACFRYDDLMLTFVVYQKKNSHYHFDPKSTQHLIQKYLQRYFCPKNKQITILNNRTTLSLTVAL